MRTRRSILGLSCFLGLTISLTGIARAQLVDGPEDGDHLGAAVATGDFNGDGYDDLAVGVPEEDAGGADSGGVEVILGGPASGKQPAGLTTVGNRLWYQNVADVEDVSESGDHLGQAVATGDFNGDGYDDLAIGVPGEDVTVVFAKFVDAGAVNVIYGSPSGPNATAVPDQLWSQASPSVEDKAEAGDHFGWAVAAGDFNADGIDDLAIAAPFEDLVATDDGVVHVLYGTRSGLTATSNQLWYQDSPGILDASEKYDEYGYSLTTGDFDGDGYDDLAIGVQGENLSDKDSPGAVSVLHGTPTGLASARNQLWHQDVDGVEGEAADGEGFGRSVASGDFNSDGYDDLAIGVPYDLNGAVYGGSVNVLYGSVSGLTATDDQIFHQDVPGIAGTEVNYEGFGWSVAAGDLNHDGYDDLVVGVPGEGTGGGVNVINGSAMLLTTYGNYLWTQDTGAFKDIAESGDAFGRSVAVGDFDRNGWADLAVGIPFENIGIVPDAGAVQVIYGSASIRDDFWYQGGSGSFAEAAEGPAAGTTSMTSILVEPVPSDRSATFLVAHSSAGHVKLVLENDEGSPVCTILDADLEAGEHTIRFEPGNLTGGDYTYRLDAEGVEESGRLTLRP